MNQSLEDKYKELTSKIKFLHSIETGIADKIRDYAEELLEVGELLDISCGLDEMFEVSGLEETLTLSKLVEDLEKDGNKVLDTKNNVTLAFCDDKSIKLLPYRTVYGMTCSVKYKDLGNGEIEVID